MERRRDRERIARRRCVCCGYDGGPLQGPRGRLVFDCPACGADLYARPARTYAELEGLPFERRRSLLVRPVRVLVGAVYRVLVRGPADASLRADPTPASENRAPNEPARVPTDP